MTKMLESSTAVFVSSWFFLTFAALIYLAEVEPPANMLTVTGPITSLTPIYSTRAGTRFRFCMGNPVLTFTYRGPAPDIEPVWLALKSGGRASVLYAPGENRTLWRLEVPGELLLTTAKFRKARMQHLIILLGGLIISGAAAAYGIGQWMSKRTRTDR